MTCATLIAAPAALALVDRVPEYTPLSGALTGWVLADLYDERADVQHVVRVRLQEDGYFDVRGRDAVAVRWASRSTDDDAKALRAYAEHVAGLLERQEAEYRGEVDYEARADARMGW